MTFTTHDLIDKAEETAFNLWTKHLAKYGGPMGLILAAANLPIQVVAEDDPTLVMRLAASPPPEMVRPMKHNAHAWAFIASRRNGGWHLLGVVPIYQTGPSDLWLFDRPVSEAEFRSVA